MQYFCYTTRNGQIWPVKFPNGIPTNGHGKEQTDLNIVQRHELVKDQENLKLNELEIIFPYKGE